MQSCTCKDCLIILHHSASGLALQCHAHPLRGCACLHACEGPRFPITTCACISPCTHPSLHADSAAIPADPPTASATTTTTTPAPSTRPYTSAKSGYSLLVPSAWEEKGKAGADVLFEDVERRSTNVGITVSPIRRVASLAEFGSLEEVGEKLLQAERNKVCVWYCCIVVYSLFRCG